MTAPSPTNPSFETDAAGVGWIVFDDPERTANVLSEPVMERLADVLGRARREALAGAVRAIVVRSAKADSFIVGADVEAIAVLEDPAEAERKVRLGQAVYRELETLPVPTVAAVYGTCAGGGTELALACTHRVLSDAPSTRVSLPEVQLGILPAWGGTTRLPRLVGVRAALDLLLTGKPMDARKARRVGFAGDVVPADLFREEVAAFAGRAPDLPRGASLSRRGVLDALLDGTGLGRRLVLASARKRTRAATGGRYPAPSRILDVLEDTLGRSVERGLDAEARAAAELIVSPVCKNLIHVFHLREAARKGRGVDGDAGGPARVGRMAVVGAGVMGGGIAQLCASNGIDARLKDIDANAVGRGLRHARELLDRSVRRGRITRREAAAVMDRIAGGLGYEGFAACDLVVEAVVERLDVKRSVLREAEDRVGPECVLATNTSSLSVDDMAGALARPERFCGMHFFNPVHRMPLVEVVRGSRTSHGVVATVHALARALGKVPVVVGDGPGFCVNRILGPYLNEAGFLLEEGAAVEEVDRAAGAFGMPMGPLRLVDEVGIDVSRHAGAALHGALGERLHPSPVLVRAHESGRMGRKGGRGFYRYEGGKERGVDATVYDDLGVRPSRRGGSMDSATIQRRLIAPMISEAARLLEEGICRSAADVDLAMIMGTGFPPFRGGLLRFADTLHPRGVLDRTLALRHEYGERFVPAPLLERLAREDRTFYEAFPG